MSLFGQDGARRPITESETEIQNIITPEFSPSPTKYQLSMCTNYWGQWDSIQMF